MIGPLSFKKRGFSLVELLIVIAILAIIAVWGLREYSELREIKRVEHTAKGLVAEIEATRADALAGKHNEEHSIKFSADSYVRFVGDSYPGDHEASTTIIDDAVLLSTTLPGDEILIFDRLDGHTGSTATITVALIEDTNVYKQVVVNESGVVQIIE